MFGFGINQVLHHIKLELDFGRIESETSRRRILSELKILPPDQPKWINMFKILN